MKKETRGRKSLKYETKRLDKTVPLEIYDLCLSLVDAECLKFKNKL
jgi:hypothetical protein